MPFLEAGLTATSKVVGFQVGRQGIVYVRFGAHSGLKSDIALSPKSARTGSRPASIDHVVGASQKRHRDSEAERLCSLEIDCKLEFDRLLDRKVSRLFALQDLVHRTRGAWIQFKKPTIENLPVLDVTNLKNSQLKQLAGVYDRISGADLGPLVQMADDPIRGDIDHAFSQVLGLPPLNELRSELGREPIITLRPVMELDVPLAPEPQLEFELL